MTDKFKVVWPSEEALNAAIASFGKDPACGVPPSVFLLDALHKAMQVDVPRLCLLEVQRFSEHLVHALFDPALAVRIRTAYLDYMERFRFPEAAPEPKMGETLHTCTMGPDCPNHQTYITPTAPAEPKSHLDKGNVTWITPPAPLTGTAWMECHSCHTTIQINAADLAEGLRLAAPPSEAPATPTPKQRLPRCHEVYCILDDDHPGPCADKPDPPFRDVAVARPEAAPATGNPCFCGCPEVVGDHTKFGCSQSQPLRYTLSADERAFLRLFIRDYLCQVDWPADLVRGADTIAAARKVAP